MRIAIVSRYATPFHSHGGLERYAFDVVRHLTALGEAVELFCEPPEACADPAGIPGVPPDAVHFVRHRTLPGLGKRPGRVILDRITNYFLFSAAAADQVARIHRERRFDVVYAQGLAAWGIARLAGSRPAATPPLVVFNHGMEEFKVTQPAKRGLYAPFRAGIRRATRSAAAVVAVDEPARAESEALLGFRPRRWGVVPVGIDLEHITALRDDDAERAWRSRLELDRRRPLLVSVARLERNKGLDVAVEALARARGELPGGWSWVVVGSGSQADALARAAGAAGIRDHVTFAGAVSDRELHALYALADLFVHPTLFEGTSIVTQEAMAHSLPIVASAAGGIPAKITSGRTGVLVPPGDAEALQRAIVDTLARPDRGRALGAAARAEVESRLAWPAVARALLAVLREAAAADGGLRRGMEPPSPR